MQNIFCKKLHLKNIIKFYSNLCEAIPHWILFNPARNQQVWSPSKIEFFSWRIGAKFCEFTLCPLCYSSDKFVVNWTDVFQHFEQKIGCLCKPSDSIQVLLSNFVVLRMFQMISVSYFIVLRELRAHFLNTTWKYNKSDCFDKVYLLLLCWVNFCLHWLWKQIEFDIFVQWNVF